MIPSSEVPLAPARDKETFGARIRRLRRAKGLSQRRLAAQVGIDFTYLSKLENDSGQSPGDDLIRRLAEEFQEDPEDLLAAAGKVPVDELRARARDDLEFARALRRLPEVPDSRITGLIAPPTDMAAITDAHILATLKISPEVSRLRSDFVANQDEYLVGIVGERAHRDRLRDANVPIHDIFVTYPAQLDSAWAADEIGRRFDISVAYRDGDQPDYLKVDLEKVEDTSALLQPEVAQDRFPLAVLRARFSPRGGGQVRRIELGYGFTLADISEEGYWFWTASRPMFVSTITVDASDLERTCQCEFGKFLPNVEWEEDEDGRHVVHVSDWLLKGHGVTLSWWPTDRAKG
jgi:transcriptional regulator with XRE-family HTH domain